MEIKSFECLIVWNQNAAWKNLYFLLLKFLFCFDNIWWPISLNIGPESFDYCVAEYNYCNFYKFYKIQFFLAEK